MHTMFIQPSSDINLVLFGILPVGPPSNFVDLFTRAHLDGSSSGATRLQDCDLGGTGGMRDDGDPKSLQMLGLADRLATQAIPSESSQVVGKEFTKEDATRREGFHQS